MTQGTLREIRETQENFLERKFSRTLSKNFKADHGSRVLTRGIFAEPKL